MYRHRYGNVYWIETVNLIAPRIGYAIEAIELLNLKKKLKHFEVITSK